jgi:hypothetical protein
MIPAAPGVAPCKSIYLRYELAIEAFNLNLNTKVNTQLYRIESVIPCIHLVENLAYNSLAHTRTHCNAVYSVVRIVH